MTCATTCGRARRLCRSVRRRSGRFHGVPRARLRASGRGRPFTARDAGPSVPPETPRPPRRSRRPRTRSHGCDRAPRAQHRYRIAAAARRQRRRRQCQIAEAKGCCLGHRHGSRESRARGVAELAGSDASAAEVEAFSAIEIALSALEPARSPGTRLRRPSPPCPRSWTCSTAIQSFRRSWTRRADPNFRNRAVRTASGHLSFVYKVAREVGELGDNTRHLRDAIASDRSAASCSRERPRKPHGARPHALGERRVDQRGQCSPGQSGGGGRIANAVRGRGAQRRRRQPSRARGRVRARDPHGNHHRREGHSVAHGATRSRAGCTSRKRSAARSTSSMVQWRSPRSPPSSPPSSCSRSEAAGRRSASASTRICT